MTRLEEVKEMHLLEDQVTSGCVGTMAVDGHLSHPCFLVLLCLLCLVLLLVLLGLSVKLSSLEV